MHPGSRGHGARGVVRLNYLLLGSRAGFDDFMWRETMTLRFVTAACAVACLMFGAIGAQANMAPPEPDRPAATAPAAAPGETAPAPAEGTAPAAAPTGSEAAPAEGAPVEGAPESAPAGDNPGAIDATADAAPPAQGGGMPWLWIAIGAALLGGLGYFFYSRNAG